MIEKRQILLPTEDIITRGEEDLFLNFNLERSFKEIKPIKYDNNFDLAKMFNDERNSSRNFCIYGSIESVDVDCDDLELDVYFPSNNIGTQDQTAGVSFIRDRELIELTDGTVLTYFDTLITNGVAYGTGNVFGKKRGIYKLDLKNFEKDVVYFAYVKAKRSTINANSEFSRGFSGWAIAGTQVNSPVWIADRNARKIFVRSNGVNTLSNFIYPTEVIDFEDFGKYKFSVRAQASTQFPVELIFNTITQDGELTNSSRSLLLNPGDEQELSLEETTFPFMSDARAVAIGVLYDINEPANSRVDLDYYRIALTPVQPGDEVSDTLDNGDFSDGVNSWNQSSGQAVWQSDTVNNTAFVVKGGGSGPLGEIPHRRQRRGAGGEAQAERRGLVGGGL